MSKFRSKLREAVQVGGKIANVAVHLTATTTSIGKLGALLGVVDAVMGPEATISSGFAGDDRMALPKEIRACAFESLRSYGRLRDGRRTDKEREFVLSAGDGHLAWVKSDGSTAPEGPWVVGMTQDQAMDALGKELWEQLGPNMTLRVSRWASEAWLMTDDLTNCLPSKLSKELAVRVKKYQAAGINRGVLLHGPPGTGKSFIMRDVAHRLGGFSIRHKCEWGSVETLEAAVELLRPRTVLIDDLDRGDTSRMLDAIESMKKSCGLIMASANYTEKLDPAIRRPGRFDESILVDKLDEETFLLLVGDAPGADITVLRELPAAYSAEYVKTRNALGQAAATGRVEEFLALRDDIEAASIPGDEKELTKA